MNNLIQLQAIGKVPAIRAEQLKPGMKRLYNWGHTAEIKAVAPSRKLSVSVTTEEMSGKTYTRTLRRTTLVGLA